jgi:hypothetical protein
LDGLFARFDFGDGCTKEKILHMKSIEIWSPLWTPPSTLETMPPVGTAVATTTNKVLLPPFQRQARKVKRAVDLSY